MENVYLALLYPASKEYSLYASLHNIVLTFDENRVPEGVARMKLLFQHSKPEEVSDVIITYFGMEFLSVPHTAIRFPLPSKSQLENLIIEALSFFATARKYPTFCERLNSAMTWSYLKDKEFFSPKYRIPLLAMLEIPPKKYQSFEEKDFESFLGTNKLSGINITYEHTENLIAFIKKIKYPAAVPSYLRKDISGKQNVDVREERKFFLKIHGREEEIPINRSDAILSAFEINLKYNKDFSQNVNTAKGDVNIKFREDSKTRITYSYTFYKPLELHFKGELDYRTMISIYKGMNEEFGSFFSIDEKKVPMAAVPVKTSWMTSKVFDKDKNNENFKKFKDEMTQKFGNDVTITDSAESPKEGRVVIIFEPDLITVKTLIKSRFISYQYKKGDPLKRAYGPNDYAMLGYSDSYAEIDVTFSFLAWYCAMILNGIVHPESIILFYKIFSIHDTWLYTDFWSGFKKVINK